MLDISAVKDQGINAIDFDFRKALDIIPHKKMFT